MPEALLFDFDGTLADTAPDLSAALNTLRIETGLPPLPYATLRRVASNGVRGLLGVGFDMAPEHPDYPISANATSRCMSARRLLCLREPHAQSETPPAALTLAAELVAADPTHCLYVGDDRRDITAGRAAGMRTVAAAWGYLGHSTPIDEWGADHLIENPGDLLALLD